MFDAQQARQQASAVNEYAQTQALIGGFLERIKQYSRKGKFEFTENMTEEQAIALRRLGYFVKRDTYWSNPTYIVSW